MVIQCITYEVIPDSAQESHEMLNQKLQAKKDWFTDRLKKTANKKNIPIDEVSCSDIANKDASDLVISSRGKRQRYQIEDFDLISKPDDYLEQSVEQIVDSLS
jgi:hypothetical protein